MVTVQNIAANKLDWYIDPQVTVRTTQRRGTGAWDVRLSVRIANPERERTSAAVESARPEPAYRDGVHRAMVAIYLPEAAFDIYSLDLPLSEYGLDPPLQMVGRRVFIEEGDEAVLDLAFSLPEEEVAALILPSARARPVHYDVNGIPVTDAATSFILWLPPGAVEDPSRAPAIAAILALTGAAAMLVGTRGRLRVATHATHLAISESLRRAPHLAAALVVAALVTLVAGAVTGGL